MKQATVLNKFKVIVNSQSTNAERCFSILNRLTPNAVSQLLTVICLPGFSHMKEIAFPAFTFSTGLTSITALNPESPSVKNSLVTDEVANKATLYIPGRSGDKYTRASGWGSFKNVVIPVTGVKLDTTFLGLFRGDTIQLHAPILPQDATMKDTITT